MLCRVKTLSFYYIYIYAVPFPTLATVPVENTHVTYKNYRYLSTGTEKIKKNCGKVVDNNRRICYTIHVVGIREATNKERTLST